VNFNFPLWQQWKVTVHIIHECILDARFYSTRRTFPVWWCNSRTLCFALVAVHAFNNTSLFWFRASHRYGYLWCPYYCCNSVVAFRLLFQEGELRFHSCISSSVSHTLCLPLHLALIFGISPLCFYQNTHSALSSFLLMAVLWQLCKIPCDWS